MNQKDIYKGRRFIRDTPQGVKTYHLDSTRWIFDCPRCEYAFPFDTHEHAVAQRTAHNVSAHQDELANINWKDSPLSYREISLDL
jgi:hypothetical protein